MEKEFSEQLNDIIKKSFSNGEYSGALKCHHLYLKAIADMQDGETKLMMLLKANEIVNEIGEWARD
jgi:hypothetical protein